MKPLRLATLLTLALAMTGCASTHDLSQSPNIWGGGIYREPLAPGLLYLVAKSNVAPWTNRGLVAEKWASEARAFCGGGYRALRVGERIDEEHDPMVVVGFSLPYLITVRQGFVVCDSAGLSDEAAAQLIEAKHR